MSEKLKEPTKEEQSEFWERCGIYQDAGVWKDWIYPDGVKRRRKPPIDLNSLFRWAVPFVERCDEDCLKPTHPCHISLQNYSQGEHWIASIMPELYKGYKKYEAQNEDPALALFWALQPVLKEV